MMTIDNEVQVLIHFLSHQVDYVITIGGHLSIYSVCGEDECWTVSWQQTDGGIVMDCTKDFSCLFDACQYFVEKRRYFCLGADFQEILNGPSQQTNDVEIINE